jgi:histidinol-phosphatase (PHP family)
MALVDYHVHPSYSIDSRGGSIRDFCEQALNAHLDEICFTTHYDIDPLRKDVDGFVMVGGDRFPVKSNWVPRYLAEVEDARREFEPKGLRVWAGLEIDYASDFEQLLREELSSFDFDYYLGAVHCINHQALSLEPESGRLFRSRTSAELVREYLIEVEKAVKSGLFHAIAHLDFYKRFGIRYYGEEILEAHRGLIEPALDLLAERGICLEINGLGYQDGFGEPYPGMEILGLAHERGLRLVTVGSDSHDLTRLGQNLDETMQIVRDFDFEVWRVPAE